MWKILFFALIHVASVPVLASDSCHHLFSQGLEAEYQQQFEEYNRKRKSPENPYWGRQKDYLRYRNSQDQNGKSIHKIFTALGFGNDEPTIKEFISRYVSLAKASGIPLSQWLLPAVVLYRGGGPDPLEIKFVTPGVDEWPKEPGFRMRSDLFFNLPHKDIVKAIQNGRYPLYNFAYHDIHHFISFILHPNEYMSSLKNKYQSISSNDLNEQLEYRLILLTETFSYPDKVQTSDLEKIFLVPRRNRSFGKIPFSNFQEFFKILDAESLKKHATTLGENLDQLLTVYGGGTLNRKEMMFYKEDFSQDFKLFRNLIPRQGNFQLTAENTMIDSPYYSAEILRQLISLHGNHKLFLTRLEEEQMSLENILDRDTARSLRDEKTAELWIEKLLRIHLARTEYLFWTMTSTMKKERFMDNLANTNGNFDPDFIELIQFAFGHQSDLFLSLKK